MSRLNAIEKETQFFFDKQLGQGSLFLFSVKNENILIIITINQMKIEKKEVMNSEHPKRVQLNKVE